MKRAITVITLINLLLVSSLFCDVIIGLTPFKTLQSDEIEEITHQLESVLQEEGYQVYGSEEMISIIEGEGMVPEELWHELSAEFLIRKHFLDMLILGRLYQIEEEYIVDVGLYFLDDDIILAEDMIEGDEGEIVELTAEMIREYIGDYIEREEVEPVRPFYSDDYEEFKEIVGGDERLSISIIFSDDSLERVGEGESRPALSVMYKIISEKHRFEESFKNFIGLPERMEITCTLLNTGLIVDVHIGGTGDINENLTSMISKVLEDIEFFGDRMLAKYRISFYIENK